MIEPWTEQFFCPLAGMDGCHLMRFAVKRRDNCVSTGQRGTAERLLYSLGQGQSCLLRGRAQDRLAMTRLLFPVLADAGVRTEQWSLTGVGAGEIPWLVHQRFGLAPIESSSTTAVWVALADYFSGAEDCELQFVCWWELDLVGPEVIPACIRLQRLMGASARHIFMADQHGSIGQQLLETHLQLQVLSLETVEDSVSLVHNAS